MNRVHDTQGEPMAATYAVELLRGELTLVMHSAGGAPKPGGMPRNADYAPGLRLLLERLALLSASVTDAYVDSTVVAELPVAERRLKISGLPYPIALANVSDFDELRRAITRSEGPIGRAPTALSSGGNERKRIRLCLNVPGFTPHPGAAARLERVLTASQSPAGPSGSGQGFNLDTASKLAIELAAMRAATEHYRQHGWAVADVSAHRSYDLHCTRDGVTRRVEVKGTSSVPRHVLLTPNEVAHALAHAPEMALFVLGQVQVTRDESGTTVAAGGVPMVLDPWLMETERLSPTGYTYALDG